MNYITLCDINNQARLASCCMITITNDRKFQWRLWGYLDGLHDAALINDDEYLKIRKHYRTYFNELSRFIDNRNRA